MPPELPSDEDDDRELLDKVDALLKRHQSQRFTAQAESATPPEHAALPEDAAATDTAPFDMPDVDDIPLLTDVVEPPAAASAPAGVSGQLLLDLEERLYRDLEARIAPQLSQAFDKALDELLSQAKIHIGAALREHLAEEVHGPEPRD